MTSVRDIVIFGSGFAAFEIARCCLERGMTVEVIERGPAMPDEEAAALSAVPYRREPIKSGGVEFGARVSAGFENASRYIGLGGTSELWSGKWRRLDGLDFQRELAGRHWPVSLNELEPWYRQVSDEIGWPELTDPLRQEVAALIESAGLRLVDIRDQTPPVRLRTSWDDMHSSTRFRLSCLSSVVAPVYDAAGRVLEAVRIQHEDSVRVIAASRFVVACGGIESVHLSHELRWPRSGRRFTEPEPTSYSGFMDHPKARIGQVRTTAGCRLLEYFEQSRRRGHLIALSLPEADLHIHSIGNHTLAMWPMESDASLLQLNLSLEQFPEEENCVLRQPAREVSWRMSRATWEDCDRFLALLVPRLRSLLGEVTLLPAFRFTGASHHAGALPMGGSSATSLGEDLRFRDIDNLYCASSAAFPVAGSANPTMTIVALSRRLAHHLTTA